MRIKPRRAVQRMRRRRHHRRMCLLRVILRLRRTGSCRSLIMGPRRVVVPRPGILLVVVVVVVVVVRVVAAFIAVIVVTRVLVLFMVRPRLQRQHQQQLAWQSRPMRRLSLPIITTRRSHRLYQVCAFYHIQIYFSSRFSWKIKNQSNQTHF